MVNRVVGTIKKRFEIIKESSNETENDTSISVVEIPYCLNGEVKVLECKF